MSAIIRLMRLWWWTEVGLLGMALVRAADRRGVSDFADDEIENLWWVNHRGARAERARSARAAEAAPAATTPPAANDEGLVAALAQIRRETQPGRRNLG